MCSKLCTCMRKEPEATQQASPVGMRTRGASQFPQLAPQLNSKKGKVTLVLDLDETLVHSQFEAIRGADYKIEIEMNGTTAVVFVKKRPYCDKFIQKCCQLFEVVIYTASLPIYADQVVQLMDPQHSISTSLFRDSCTQHRGLFVKDLSLLGRDMNKVIIIDNSPSSYLFHPQNAIPISSWFDDMQDRELKKLFKVLQPMSKAGDVVEAIKKMRWPVADVSCSSIELNASQEQPFVSEMERLEQDRGNAKNDKKVAKKDKKMRPKEIRIERENELQHRNELDVNSPLQALSYTKPNEQRDFKDGESEPRPRGAEEIKSKK